MTRDEMLTGWMCFIRHNFDNETTTNVPSDVREALIEKGWLEVDAEADWDGKHNARITDAGYDVTDLSAPEWGITLDLGVEN